MAAKISRALFGKKMKIVMIERDIPQQELAKHFGVASSTVSDIIYSHNQCERTKERIAEILGIKG